MHILLNMLEQNYLGQATLYVCIYFISLEVNMFILNFFMVLTGMEEAILSSWLQKEQGS